MQQQYHPFTLRVLRLTGWLKSLTGKLGRACIFCGWCMGVFGVCVLGWLCRAWVLCGVVGVLVLFVCLSSNNSQTLIPYKTCT